MKKHLLCTALGALVLNTGASADIEYTLTIALTASYTDAALRERDENGRIVGSPNELVYENNWSTERGNVSTYNEEEGSRIIVDRVSNREILDEFIVEGGIDSSIRGWAIKLAIPSQEGDEGDVVMYACKGDEIHVIPFSIGIGASAEQYRRNYSESYNSNTDRTTFRESGSARLVEEMFGFMQVNEYRFSFGSILNINETLRFFKIDDETLRVWFPSTIQVNSISGNLGFSSDSEFLTALPQDDDSYDDDYEFSDVLQGRMIASRGKLILSPR